MSKVRVAFLLHAVDHTSVPRITLCLASLLNQELFLPIVVSCCQPTLNTLNETQQSLKIVSLGLHKARTTFAIPRLVRFLRRWRPHIVVSFVNGPNRTAIIARLLSQTDTKLVICEHNTFSKHPYDLRFMRCLLTKLLYPLSDKVVAVSQGVMLDLLGFVPKLRDKIVTIPNPVVSDSLKEMSNEPLDHPWLRHKRAPIVLNVANLRPRKDHETLIKAFYLFRQQSPGRLLILGEDDHGRQEQLSHLATSLGIECDVQFLGFQKNPYKYMKGADLFVLSSLEEGLPTVLIEAMACGLPVISTDCPSGPREIITHGLNGMLVPVQNPEKLAEAMLTVIKDPCLAERLRVNGLKRSMDFTAETVVQRYEQLLLELIGVN